MIEINLIPEVKKELLKTQKTRNIVTSIAIIAGMISVGLVVLIGIYVYGAQQIIMNGNENQITEQQAIIDGLVNPNTGNIDVLVLQDQLQQISDLEGDKYLVSRIFGIIDAIRKAASESTPVTLSSLIFNKETNTISIEGSSMDAFQGLEAFKKTALLTKFTFADPQGEPVEDELLIADEALWTTSEQRLAEDANGNRVVRFNVAFTISEDAIAFDTFDSTVFRIQIPGAQNVTDSVVQIPTDMFAQRAVDEEGR
jgi:hypothetical protein